MSLLFGIFGRIGSFLTSFRSKKTTIEQLEYIDKEIKNYEKYKQKYELNERKYIGALVLYSIVFYIIGAFVYYIYLMPKNLAERLKTLIPFFVSPLIIYFIRRFLKWFYIKRTTYCEKKLEDLKAEKKSILEEVKEKETYKKAREILERFSSGVDISITPPSTPNATYSATPYVNKPGVGLNDTTFVINKNNLNATTLVHRNIRQIQQTEPRLNGQLNSTQNNGHANKTLSNMSLPSSASNSQQNLNNGMAQGPPASLAMGHTKTLLPRPIIAPNRTIFDKLLDFLIGEGPNNRYALICKSCHFHNGMALKEEFEFVAFRCAYCLFYNEARKAKLTVPKNRPNQNTEMNESHVSSNVSMSTSFDDMATNSEPIVAQRPSTSNDNEQLKPNKSETNLTKLSQKNSLGDSTKSLHSHSSEKSSTEKLSNGERKTSDVTENDVDNSSDECDEDELNKD